MLGFIGQKLGQVFSNFSSGKKDLQAIEKEVFNIFMDADVPFKVSGELSSVVAQEFGKISKNALRGTVKAEESLKYSVYKVLSELFEKVQTNTNANIFSGKKIWTVFGPVGSGKTTTTAKLAGHSVESLGYKKQDVLVASIDNIRNAGSEQLGVLCSRINIEFLDLSDSKTQFADLTTAISNKKLVFIDTPGQWSMNEKGLDELKAFLTGTKEQIGKICIVDSMIGQMSLSMIGMLDAAVGINFGVLTKVDSEAKGGVAVGFVKNLSLPIAFICDGEGVQDIQPFLAKQFVQRLLGYGDLEGLSCKIESGLRRLEESKNSPGAKDRLLEKIKDGEYDFQTLLDQVEMMQSMGPLSKLVSYLPGLSGINKELVDQQQHKFARYKVIVQSMTHKELKDPRLMSCASRRLRIARGSGICMAQMDEFLKEFAIMKKNIKMISSFY